MYQGPPVWLVVRWAPDLRLALGCQGCVPRALSVTAELGRRGCWDGPDELRARLFGGWLACAAARAALLGWLQVPLL